MTGQLLQLLGPCGAEGKLTAATSAEGKAEEKGDEEPVAKAAKHLLR